MAFRPLTKRKIGGRWGGEDSLASPSRGISTWQILAFCHQTRNRKNWNSFTSRFLFRNFYLKILSFCPQTRNKNKKTITVSSYILLYCKTVREKNSDILTLKRQTNKKCRKLCWTNLRGTFQFHFLKCCKILFVISLNLKQLWLSKNYCFLVRDEHNLSDLIAQHAQGPGQAYCLPAWYA